VVTPEYVRLVSLKSRGVDVELDVVAKVVRRLHDYMDREFVRRLKGARFRVVAARDLIRARSMTLERVSYMRNRFSEDACERVARIVSL
jgi:hypothetical protein